MDFLAEFVAATEPDPIRDVIGAGGARDSIIWLDDLPDGTRLRRDGTDGVVLRLQPPHPVPEPSAGPGLSGWLDSDQPRGADGPEPTLLDTGPAFAAAQRRTTPPVSVVVQFTAWRSQWRSWARGQRRLLAMRRLYEKLERVAKTLEQQDDQYELVLAVGLLQWATPGRERIRRHLLTEQAVATLDRDTAELSVRVTEGRRRVEDREFLEGHPGYRAEPGRAARQAVLDSAGALPDARVMALLQDLLGACLSQPVDTSGHRPGDDQPLPGSPLLTASPALILRRRSRVRLAEAYRRFQERLRGPDARIPVGLAQLVVETEAVQRDRWLHDEGALSGDLLGADPLFPLPTNDEQRQVIDLLRTETGVAVQGPPGTGKTHTIANLVCALLARGQRILVTSQKEQALRVLREMIPAQLRDLCMLLAGGGPDTATELRQSLDALSAAITSPHARALPQRIAALSAQRHRLLAQSADLDRRIRELRQVECVIHRPVDAAVGGGRYQGTLGEMVRRVKEDSAVYGWMPPVPPEFPDIPPLSVPEALELLHLLRGDRHPRRVRLRQRIPDPQQLPAPAVLVELFAAERTARTEEEQDTDELARRLAAGGPDLLAELRHAADRFTRIAQRLGLDGERRPARTWLERAVGDHLSGRDSGLWSHLAQVQGEVCLQKHLHARGLGCEVEAPPVEQLGIGPTRGMLASGRRLRDYLAGGGRCRSVLPPAVQKHASQLLETVRVDGQPPTTLPLLEAALDHLEAQVVVAQLVRKWAEAQVAIPTGGLTATLSALQDADRHLADIRLLAQVHAQIMTLLQRVGLRLALPNVPATTRVLRALAVARQRIERQRASVAVEALYQSMRDVARQPGACPELGALVDAIRDRDLDGYRQALDAIHAAWTERDEQGRQDALADKLSRAHPRLFAMLQGTAVDQAWDARLADLHAAWAWSKAQQFVRGHRTAEEERRLSAEYDATEDRIRRTTTQLAAAQAMETCLRRMTDAQARALRGYRQQAGRDTPGAHAAIEATMEKARTAVPAWVVPLPNLLEILTPEPDSFDVVIVDEASQVGVESLFLLWMAPRVIVVGDDRQCTPTVRHPGRGLDELFARLHERLGDPYVRQYLTAESHLYGLLSARLGRNAVVRLREHFRCMPEIITWCSRQFYDDHAGGLVPLRERAAHHLAPLRVVHVTDAGIEGAGPLMRNPVEAKCLVAQLVECLADPRYDGRTFGIVVLEETGQVELLDDEINAAVSPEDRAARRIRVGVPADFQGDERDVVFLSTVVGEAPRVRATPLDRQAFNVAASRARDQLWLFTSVPPDRYPPGDLRGALATYMLEPPVLHGPSPDLAAVSTTRPSQPFESLLEQRVYRAVKERGYHVVPQVRVGRYRLGLVIAGDGGRLAVECDGYRWHPTSGGLTTEPHADRELRRMGWETIRVRESEFELDADRELAPLWRRLHERDIRPVGPRPQP